MWENALRIGISLFGYLHLWKDSQNRDLRSGCRICDEAFLSKDFISGTSICEKSLSLVYLVYLDHLVLIRYVSNLCDSFLVY